VLAVLKVGRIFVVLSSLVMILIYFPKYVKVALFCGRLSLTWFGLSLFLNILIR
jgi:hypothetical protein